MSWAERRRGVAAVLGAVGLVVALAGCAADAPDRHPQADQLTQQIRLVPGVVSATYQLANSFAQGRVYLEVDVELADGATGDELAAVASAFLDHLRAVDYSGYRTELEAHLGANTFAIDSGHQPVSNGEQIIAQARGWPALLRDLPGATVALRATIAHPAGEVPDTEPGHPSFGRVRLPNAAAYPEVAAAFATLAVRVPDLASGNWTVEAGNEHPAQITTSQRWPDGAEMAAWNALNADQSIPHFVAMTINGASTGPLWVSEVTTSRSPDEALELARRHLPVVARLPAPVLYTATDAWLGHLDFYGRATRAVVVTVGGCTKRTYAPAPAEQTLIDVYETCRR